jgi:DnaK suppressor protein
MSESDLEKIRKTLTRRLEEVRRSIDDTAASRKPVQLDQTSVGRLSRMDSLQMQAMALAEERMRNQEIERIRGALMRMDSGDFGYCLGCGEEIAPKRLAVDPTSATCIRCASGTDR